MNIEIGEIVYEQVLSLDVDNYPITASTFDVVLFFNNEPYSGNTPSYYLTDASRRVFTFSWSGDSYGQYQLYAKNSLTNVIFISNIVDIKPTIDSNIYIGL